MQLLTHLIWVTFLGHLGSLSAQLPPSPVRQSVPGPQLLSMIRLEEPILFPGGKVVLQWHLQAPRRGGYVNLERAADRKGPFEIVSVQKEVGDMGSHQDEHPPKGLVYYRMRWVLDDGSQYLSNLVEASLSGDISCRFYPNPVDNILIVRSEQDLDLLITDGNGLVKKTARMQKGLQTVDLSHLDKGLYIITLTQRDTGRSRTEKLVKN